MADPTLRDTTWGSLSPAVALDLVRATFDLAAYATVEVTPSHDRTIGGREVDVEVQGLTLAQVRQLAALVDERVASGPAGG